MSVRRNAGRLVAGALFVAGLLSLGAAPAAAAGDTVRVRSASTFTAGGGPGAVRVEVSRRAEGCVLLRTALGIRLAGVTPDRVRAQVSLAGQWAPLPVSQAGDGALVTARTAPENPLLCKGRSVTVRYRLTFTAAAPNGRLTVIGEAFNATGRLLGTGDASAQVVGGQAVTATPKPARTPKPTPKPTVTPSAVATEDPLAPDEALPTADQAVPTLAGPVIDRSDTGGGFGLGALVMVLGAAMVAVGAVLIVFLVRHRRDDAPALVSRHPAVPAPGDTPSGPAPTPGPPPPVGGSPGDTLVLPRLPGDAAHPAP